MAISGPSQESDPPYDGIAQDPEVERAIRKGKASFDLWVDAWFYSRAKFNESEVSRERYRKYRDTSLEGEGLFGAFVAQEGEVVSAYYCDDVPSAAALTKKPRGRVGPFRPVTPNLLIVANAPPGSDSSPLAGFALGLLEDCSVLSRRAEDYLPRRIRNQFMEELYGLTTDGMFLLDEAARHLGDGLPQDVERETNVLVKDAISRLTVLRDWLDTAAKNASQFFYLRGVFLGAVLSFALAWFVAAVFPSPISRHDAAWALASGGAGALVSVLIRVKTSGLVLDYAVGPLRLLFLGAIRPLLGGIAGVLFLLATIAGVIPLSRQDGTAQRVALYVLGSFAAGFNERWVQDMLANVGERIQQADKDQRSDVPNDLNPPIEGIETPVRSSDPDEEG